MPKRTDIKTAIAAALSGTDAGSNVFVDRVSSLDVAPSLVILSGAEEINDIENGHGIRRFLVEIQLRVQGQNLGQIDTIEAQVFSALEGSKLAGAVMSVRWGSNSAPELDGGGDQPFGLMIIIYEVIYAVD